MAPPSLIPADRRWIQAAGAAILLTALGALVGRAIGNLILVQWVPGESGMVLPAALGMMVIAAGLFAVASASRRTIIGCSALLISGGLAELAIRTFPGARNLPSADAQPLWTDLPHQLSHMAPDTSAALALAGLIFFLRAFYPEVRNIIAALAGVIGVLAFLPLLQCAAWLMTSGSPDGYHGMAVPTSFCLIVLAAALIRAGRAPTDGALSFMSAALGMMFSIGVGAVRTNGELLAASREVTRTYQVRAAIAAFVEQVARAESSSRGYALSGEPYFRDRVLIHEREASRLLDALQKQVSNNPAQLARIVQIRRLAAEKAQQNDRLLATRNAAGTPAAGEYLSSLLAIPGQPSSNLVIVAAQMGTEEEKLLAARSHHQLILERATRMVQLAGSVIVAALLISAIIFTRRASAARRAAEAQFRGSFEDAGIGMALIGLDGSWLRVNRSVLELLGYSNEELSQLTFQQITHPDDLADDLALVGDLVAGRARTYRLVKRYLHRDGHIVWGNLTVSIVRQADGSPSHFISQIEDITAQKRLEEELRSARDEALAAAKVKSEFLATMSHEIRTPLNGILGMTNLLLDSGLNPEQKEMADTVESCGENLLRVLNDILDFSAMEAGRLSLVPTWFNLHQLVGETMALYAPQASGKRVALKSELAVETEGMFWADAGRIQQVLNNLVGNALKFTQNGAVIVAATVELEEENRASVLLRVSDTGIGIASEDQGRLFRTFTQVDGSDRRKYGGTGLGLAISKRIIELMGGEIGLTSRPGSGSTFWFRLPLRRGEVPAELAVPDVRPTMPTALIGARVLVAEDNLAGQLVARMTLKQMGYLVDVVASGEAVFTQLAKLRYDAVVMDCQMPDLDGIETTRRIRSGQIPGVDPRIPIIALTAAAFPEDQARCLAAGMNEFLSKPLRAADLGAALHRVGCAGYFPSA